jgi:hypothetical protein
VDGRRVQERPAVGRPGLVGDRSRRPAERVQQLVQPQLGAGPDQPLGKVGRLGQQQQVPAAKREPAVHRLPHVERGEDVEHGQAPHRVGEIQGQPVADERPPVVPDDRESPMAEGGHQPMDVGSHGPLRVALVTRIALGLVAIAIAAQVRADDGELTGQPGRDRMPAGVVLGIAVEQDHRRSLAAQGHLERDLTGLDPPAGELRQQHLPRRPGGPCWP